ncbi:MAG: DUF1501 domain-containing protein [Planctomycetia bacterium]
MNRASEAEFLVRRRMVQASGLAAFGSTASGSTADAPPATADHCIVVFLNGGPSHLDMWDLKPEAPPEIRGPFKPIATSLPGVSFGEHLPKLAQWMHECTLVRSMRHSVNNAHGAAVYTSLTGHDRGEKGGAASAEDYPAIGSVAALKRPPATAVAPFVSLPYITQEGRGGPPQPGFFGGWLGRSHDPLFILRDPNAAGFSIPELTPADDVPADRLTLRNTLLQTIDQPPAPGEAGRTLRTVDAFRRRAVELLSSPATQKAFRLDREPDAVRDAYGRNIYGQSVLLSRRLVEAGARVVTVSWAPDANATWDTHGDNFNRLKNELLPQMDAAVSSLLTDLSWRGLLGRTFVAVMGEFGRTPRINAGQGRDHWNHCYSLLLAGGGVRRGFVYGSSDRIGAFPKDLPTTPADVVATLYRCLGVSPTTEIVDRLGRAFTLAPWGRPVDALLA